ncbi:DUF3429 domain-containing protein [Marinomonas transparens]|uniref:DUF3429 domain-containing protein n=1 Tax=Marinomonas transparens TaxID=2795388 RepID=A0A934JP88_9GAMM|nr:DUF3429 domain-containing protein [Marinomonas transparens]MBJ7537228.1 DUF3429 domain-containing protein [Marinomonas transparens]
MRTYSQPLVIILGVLGMIPFVFSAYLSLTAKTFLDVSGTHLFTTYSALILSYLSGMLWGQVIHKEKSTSGSYLLICSNVLSYGAWASLIINVPELSIALLLLGFISVFWVDARWIKFKGNSHTRYTNMRFLLTIFVCVLHLLVLFPHY